MSPIFFCQISTDEKNCRVADPDGWYPDPTFEKKPDQYPNIEKKPDLDPTLKNNPYPDLFTS